MSSDPQKALKKACSIEETAPKRKHVRSLIVYTWDHQSAREVFNILRDQPFVGDEVQLFKSLIVLHKIIQEGHPSALKVAIKERSWIKSLARVHTSGSDYSRLIREYVKYLVLKLNFHADHKGFNNGVFEYEEYVSLVSVADPDEGYETISDLMTLEDSADQFAQVIFASIQSDVRNAECRISALIPMIAETYGIYKFITSMLRAMYRQLNTFGDEDDVLQPLRERYELIHARLFEFYADCSSIKYLTTLVTIPKLPTEPPDVSSIGNDGYNDTIPGKEIKFEKRQKAETQQQQQPEERAVSSSTGKMPVPKPVEPRPSTTPATTGLTAIPTAATSFMLPMQTAATTGVLPMQPTAALPADFWNTQQQQFINQQQQLEQERQAFLQNQQQQQQYFQQQLEKAQQDMLQMQLQQQSQHQNDLIALTDQYERDQSLLQQYDQRVQQLEQEIEKINENSSRQLESKTDQVDSLTEQLHLIEKKYDKLAKLYSQLRQEHLNLLPRFKKLQLKFTSLQETLKQREADAAEVTQKSQQIEDLTRDRDRLRLENDKLKKAKNEDAGAVQAQLNSISENKLVPILDAVLQGGILAIQESLYSLEASPSSQPSSTSEVRPNYILSLIESSSEKATDFAYSFNDLIVDGTLDGDQINVILNINDFSNSIVSLVSNINLFTSSPLFVLRSDEAENIIKEVKRCAHEAQFFFEDLLSENLNQKPDDEAKTDVVINANVEMQSKLQELTFLVKPFLEAESMGGAAKNPQQELVTTAERIAKSSQKLRVNIDMDVPKPLLSMVIAITDAVLSLVKAAIECQNEIAKNNKTQTLSQFYLKNSRWTEGLISASRAVASATNLLITIGTKLVEQEGKPDSDFSLEEFIVASREVAASTIQLVAASRVKTSLHSKAQQNLETSSNGVSDACKALVNHILAQRDEGKSAEEQAPIDFSSDRALKTMEMEQQVTILKLEQALNAARNRLYEIRKHAYYLHDDDDDDGNDDGRDGEPNN